MTEQILVTVITPCFNSRATIKDTLESVLHQTYENIEYIIIDGGSTDGTLDVIRQYEKKFQGRMKVVSEKDDGIYDAMNKGISMASGQLVGIVNSDDYYETDAVEIMVNAMRPELKYQILYGFQRCLENRKEVRVVLFHHNYLKKQMITHPTCFVTRNVYTDYGMFDLKYRSSADYEFVLRLFQETDVNFIPVYHIISNFELGGMSSTQKGVRETMGLYLKYGTINRRRYCWEIARSYLAEWKNKLKRKLG